MMILSPDSSHPHAKAGALSATAAFLVWGVVPIYWKQMHGIPALELIAHRMVWSLLFLLGILAVQGKLGDVRAVFRDRRLLGYNLLTGVVLTVNWTVYVWAVNAGHVIESSLGYFLVPLCNVALGSVLLHERLRKMQWSAIALAGLGVALLLFGIGQFPWIALSLAITWSSYALLKKKSALGPLTGLTMETLLLFPLAGGFLVFRQYTGEGALGHVDAWHHVLVLSVGVVTAIPLLLFAHGAQRIRLTTLGLLQYIAPTVQFLIGVYFYHEPFERSQLMAYALIWGGLVVYTADSFWTQRHRMAAMMPLRAES